MGQDEVPQGEGVMVIKFGARMGPHSSIYIFDHGGRLADPVKFSFRELDVSPERPCLEPTLRFPDMGLDPLKRAYEDAGYVVIPKEEYEGLIRCKKIIRIERPAVVEEATDPVEQGQNIFRNQK